MSIPIQDIPPIFSFDLEQEFLVWLNNNPTDAPRRHLTAVRWKNWRLYKHKELGWQLFDLKSDPKEENDVAGKKPEVVETMKTQHVQWAKTLAPLGKIPRPNSNLPPITPFGYGWAYAGDANGRFDGARKKEEQ